MRHGASPRSHEAGFTLIELLVGTLIISATLVSLTSFMQGGLRFWKQAEASLRLQQEAQRALDLIGREFKHAVDVPGCPWTSKAGEVSFATASDTDGDPAGDLPPRLLQVSYRLTAAGDAMEARLMRRERHFGPNFGSSAMDSTLTSYPTQLSWAYAYASGNSDSPVRWERDWRETDSLPCGIRLELSLRDEAGDVHRFMRTLLLPAGVLKPWML